MNLDDFPQLTSHTRLTKDPITGSSILLYPEGILELSPTAAEMISLSDGTRNVHEIAEILHLRYEALLEEIESDLLSFFQELSAKGYLKAKS